MSFIDVLLTAPLFLISPAMVLLYCIVAVVLSILYIFAVWLEYTEGGFDSVLSPIALTLGFIVIVWLCGSTVAFILINGLGLSWEVGD